MARSSQGVHFERVEGPGPLGSVFGPSPDAEDFDGETVGVIDVSRVGDEWWMWYLGTNAEPRSTDYGMIRGAGHLPGLARSSDGINWTRVRGDGPGGALLPYIGDTLFTSWPNAVYSEGRFWLYVTITGRSIDYFDTHYATSEDGVTWTYQGPMPWRDGVRAWESGGIMTRSVQANPCSIGKAWLMLYTALDGGAGAHKRRSIGAVTSDDLVNWSHLYEEPIFEGSGGDAWDGAGVAAPQLIVSRDETRLYYLGMLPDHKPPLGLGLAITHQKNLIGFERVKNH